MSKCFEGLLLPRQNLQLFQELQRLHVQLLVQLLYYLCLPNRLHLSLLVLIFQLPHLIRFILSLTYAFSDSNYCCRF